MKGITELSLECTFCLIDHKPIDVSPAYRDLVANVGKRVANRWTYVERIPIIQSHPPPGSEQNGRYSRTVHTSA